jgi:hypothetical protein
MTTQVIPSDQWERFFSRLSREYAGRMVTVEMVPESQGPQLVAFDQPFRGMVAADEGGRTVITIRLGEEENDLTIETPLRIHTSIYESGGGQVVEVEAAGTPLTRLYLSHSRERSSGRGEIYGGQSERSVGQEAAPGAAYSGQPDRHDYGIDSAAGWPEGGTESYAQTDATHELGEWEVSGAGGGQSLGTGAPSDFGGAAIAGAGITGADTGAGADAGDLDLPRDYVDESTRAAGIAGERNTGGGYGPPAGDQPPQAGDADRNRGANRAGANFDAGAGAADAEDTSVPLGIGLGGVRGVGGGSLGDRDLSERGRSELDALQDITDVADTRVGPGSDVGFTGAVAISGNDRASPVGNSLGPDVDVADLGEGRGVIDTTRDPIGGTGDEDNGMDESDDMVAGEVGAQAERDLTDLLGKRAHNRPDPDDARLQQALTDLIEEDDDEEDDSR